MSAPRIPGLTYIQHIGQGGFADVFLYEQEWPRQRVAVKVVRPDVPLTDREKGMFTTEANAMARLSDHPYIVSVLTAGVTSEQEGSRPYLVMRYCPPPDLGQRVTVQADVGQRGGGHRHQARQRHRDRAPLGHPAPRHQAVQRARHDVLRAGAHRLRHRRPAARGRGRRRRPDQLPVVAARAPRRPLQRLGGLRRLLAGRHDLEPARRTVPVLDPERRQHLAGADGPHPALHAAAHPAPRRTHRRSTCCSSSAWPSSPSTAPRAPSRWRGRCSGSRPRPGSRAP